MPEDLATSFCLTPNDNESIILYMNDNKLDDPFDIYQEPEEIIDEPGVFTGVLINDETITQEQINEMKMLGIERPESVSSERWYRLQGERMEHTHMVHMAASGIPQKDIAAIMGYDQAHVSKVLNTPEIKDKVKNEIISIYGADHKKALKDRAMKAIEVVDTILQTGKESEMASMAKWVLEHSVGKASQDIQVTKTTLTEVIFKIDQMRSDQLRDVSSSSANLPKPTDPFDTIIEQIIPQGMVIGKRSNGEGQT